MLGDDPFEIVGKMRAPFRLAGREGLMLAAIGRREMIHSGQKRAEEFAVVDNTADRNAAKAHAVITALAADQAGPAALPAYVVIGERNLEGGIDRLGAGIAEEYPVEVAGCERGEPAREFERFRMSEVEGRRVVQFG